MTPDDAWLAGLFEGEGCLTRRSSDGNWQLTIKMCDEDVVRRAQKVARVGTITALRPDRPGWSPQWRFRTCKRDDIAALLQRLLPYLGQRRSERAHEFLRWYNAGAPVSTTPEHRAREAEVKRERRARRRALVSGGS